MISFSTSNNTISRDLKRLLGKDFSPSKVKTDISKQLINMDEKSLKLLDRAEGNVMDFIDEDNIKPVDAVPMANIRKAKALPLRNS